jgi:hypothetical protein
MGKVRQTRQGIMIRFDEYDADLVDWLGQYAQSQTMTRIVKLACYLFAGLPVPATLESVAPGYGYTAGPQDGYEAPPANWPAAYESNEDTLAAVMQEIAALREAVTAQQASRSEWAEPVPDEIPAQEEASSMMGDSRRRRRREARAERYAGGGGDTWTPPEPEADPGGGVDAQTASGLDFSRPRRSRSTASYTQDFQPAAPIDPEPEPDTLMDGRYRIGELVTSIRSFIEDY